MIFPRKELLIAAVVSASITSVATCKVRADHRLFQRVAPSTVLVEVKTKAGVLHGGGVFIDRLHFAILTAAHLVEDAESILVLFPDLKDGQVITAKNHYLSEAKDSAAPAKVRHVDRDRNVAILTVSRFPSDVPAIEMADRDPQPGQVVFAIGHSSWKRGGAFGFMAGHVRCVYPRLQDGTRIFESDLATGRGDGGAPIIDEKGRLAGIVSEAVPGQFPNLSVNVSEIRAVLVTVGIAKEGLEPAVEALPSDDEITQSDLDQIISDLNANFADGRSGRLLLQTLTETDFNPDPEQIADTLGIRSPRSPVLNFGDFGIDLTQLFATEETTLELVGQE